MQLGRLKRELRYHVVPEVASIRVHTFKWAGVFECEVMIIGSIVLGVAGLCGLGTQESSS